MNSWLFGYLATWLYGYTYVMVPYLLLIQAACNIAGLAVLQKLASQLAYNCDSHFAFQIRLYHLGLAEKIVALQYKNIMQFFSAKHLHLPIIIASSYIQAVISFHTYTHNSLDILQVPITQVKHQVFSFHNSH